MGVIGGTELAEVVIVGAGTVGLTAARTALGIGSRVTLLDISEQKIFLAKFGP